MHPLRERIWGSCTSDVLPFRNFLAPITDCRTRHLTSQECIKGMQTIYNSILVRSRVYVCTEWNLWSLCATCIVQWPRKWILCAVIIHSTATCQMFKIPQSLSRRGEEGVGGSGYETTLVTQARPPYKKSRQCLFESLYIACVTRTCALYGVHQSHSS